MAFLKTKVAKGRYYYALAESYRDDQGKPRQRIISNLGSAQKAMQYFNCRDNELEPGDYLSFVKKVAMDNVKECVKCGSSNMEWIPNPPHWSRYSCRDCRHMDWYDNSIF